MADSLRQRHLDWKASGATTQREYPGLDVDHAEALNASDFDGVLNGFRGWQDDDDVAQTHGRDLVDRYSRQAGSAESAQLDLVRYDALARRGGLDADLSGAWAKARTVPQHLSPSETDELFSTLRSVGERTDGMGFDMAADPVGQVGKISKTKDGPVLHVRLPQHWSGGGAKDPKERTKRLKGISHQALAQDARSIWRRLFDIAVRRQLDPESQAEEFDGTDSDIFFGLEQGEALVDQRLLVDVISDAAGEAGVDPDSFHQMARAAWNALLSESSSLGWQANDPFRFPAEDGENRTFQILDGQTPLNPGETLSLPESALTVSAADDEALQLPDGSSVVVAQINDTNAARFRNLYPAVVGSDGKTRWLPIEPAPVAAVSEVAALVPASGRHESFLNASMANDHPLTLSGESVAFDLPSGSRLPGELRSTVQQLGRTVSAQPARSQERLRADQIDPGEFMDPAVSPLTTHDWSLVPNSGDSEMLAQLKRQGYHPIPTTEGDMLVFGLADTIDPEWTPDDQISLTLNGADITINPADFAVDSFEPARNQSIRRGFVQGDAAALAEQLEALGAENLVVYSNKPELDGWKPAFESLFTDGVSTHAVRSTSAPLTAPHAGRVFVRSVDGLPDRAPEPALAVDELPAVLDGDGTDLLGAARDAAFGRLAGGSVRAVRSDGGTFQLSDPREPSRPEVRLADGSRIPHIRRDELDPEWSGEFGFDFDPSFRVGNAVHRLGDQVVEQLRSVTASFAGSSSAADVWGLSRVAVSPGIPSQYAQTTADPGGAVVLTKDWWSDTNKLTAAIQADQAAGILTKRAEPGPAGVLAHEYGHVAAQAAMLLAPDLDEQVRKLLGKDWRKQARKALSITAATDEVEVVAEAFSELLTGTPSGLSREVVDMVNAATSRKVKVNQL